MQDKHLYFIHLNTRFMFQSNLSAEINFIVNGSLNSKGAEFQILLVRA